MNEHIPDVQISPVPNGRLTAMAERAAPQLQRELNQLPLTTTQQFASAFLAGIMQGYQLAVASPEWMQAAISQLGLNHQLPQRIEETRELLRHLPIEASDAP